MSVTFLRTPCTPATMNSTSTLPRNLRHIALLVLLVAGCGREEPSDAEMLQRDQELLAQELDGVLLDQYKFIKTTSRMLPVLDTSIAEHRRIKELMHRMHVEQFVGDSSATSAGNASSGAIDLASIGQFVSDYLELRSFVREHDEDEFPTILEGQAMASGDSVATILNGERIRMWPPLHGEAKTQLQSVEHTLLSVFLLFDRTRTFTKKMLVYECSKSDMAVHPGSDAQVLLQLTRGFLFHDQGLRYLSEKEYSENLLWLEENPGAELPLTETMLVWAPLFLGVPVERIGIVPREAAYHSLVLTNHTMRALARAGMEREIDQKRLLEDYEAIVNTAHKAGLDNELVWAVEAYLYLKEGKNEEAAAALGKLEKSKLLGDDERATINAAKGYVDQREPDKALNGVYDALFLNRVLIRYMSAKAGERDWVAILEKAGIIEDNGLSAVNKRMVELLELAQAANSADSLKGTADELMEKGKDLLPDGWK